MKQDKYVEFSTKNFLSKFFPENKWLLFVEISTYIYFQIPYNYYIQNRNNSAGIRNFYKKLRIQRNAKFKMF